MKVEDSLAEQLVHRLGLALKLETVDNHVRTLRQSAPLNSVGYRIRFPLTTQARVQHGGHASKVALTSQPLCPCASEGEPYRISEVLPSPLKGEGSGGEGKAGEQVPTAL